MCANLANGENRPPSRPKKHFSALGEGGRKGCFGTDEMAAASVSSSCSNASPFFPSSPSCLVPLSAVTGEAQCTWRVAEVQTPLSLLPLARFLACSRSRTDQTTAATQ
jgi:hypothetical protein